jgi:predicted histone-like DNA-binding protein
MQLAQETAVGPGDVMNVLWRLGAVVAAELQRGHSVRLPDLGTFYITIDSKLVEVVTEFIPGTHIVGGRVRFRTAQELREVQDRLRFELFTGSSQAGAIEPASEA